MATKRRTLRRDEYRSDIEKPLGVDRTCARCGEGFEQTNRRRMLCARCFRSATTAGEYPLQGVNAIKSIR